MKKLILLALLIMPVLSAAQTPSKRQRLDTLFKTASVNGQFNGAVLVAEKGNPVYEVAIGYSDADGNLLSIDSQFALAQVTRQFTTMAVMMLKDQGKLKYSDNVKKYIPDLPYEGITIYHLLTFTDGLPYIGDLVEEAAAKRGNLTVKDIVELLAEKKPEASAPPGQELGWNGTGSVLMAYIIEKASGERYADFLEKHIFDPLKMDHTYIFDPKNSDGSKNRAHVIKFAINGKDVIANGGPESALIGDVGIYSTLSDLLKWDRALYTEKLVKKPTLQAAFTPAKLANGTIAEDDASRVPGLGGIGTYNFGFGWDLDTLYGSRTVFHGIFPPNGGVIFRNIDKDRTIILLMNNSTQNMRFYHFKIFDRVLRIMNGLSVEPLKRSIGDAVGGVFVEKGITEAIATYHRLKGSEANVYNFNDPMELFTLGNQLLTKGKTDEALEIFKLNAKEFPHHPYSYFLLTRIYMMKKDYAAAKRTVKKVIEILPDSENAKQMLKMIEAQMKRNKETK